MVYDELLRKTVKENSTKILYLIMDGLGGLPGPDGRTELEAARKPEIDKLAKRSALGLIDPVATGITPGSGPAHLAIFGYDPLKWEIGRGILSALGIGFEVEPSDLTARGNYATLDKDGKVVDRRAGRIPTELNRELSALLDGMKVGSTQVFVRPEKEHRVAVIFRGDELSDLLTDSDPQATGVSPRKVEPLKEEARQTATIVEEFLTRAHDILKDKSPANGILLRGFAKLPTIPQFEERYRMRACAIATYPMYKGLARLVGMEVLECGEDVESQIEVLKQVWDNYDFFYFHYKKTDSKGEDGDFSGKVSAIEAIDRYIPELLSLNPDVLVLTGDHSTPSAIKMHSWHPVPLLLFSPWIIPDGLAFTERNCARGILGRMRALELLPLAMANARRLEKFGA